MHEMNVVKHFWAEAVNIACYIQNIVWSKPILNKNPYELWKSKKSNISYFHQFGYVCYISNTIVYAWLALNHKSDLLGTLRKI